MEKWKKSNLKTLFFMLMASVTSPLFAQGIDKLQPVTDKILAVFTGPFVKTILIIFFCASAVAYGFNKDNEKMKRNCLAVGIAVAIIGAASFVVGEIWSAAGL